MSGVDWGVEHGWNYRPDTYRCDRGWNDTAGYSYGCREPGIEEIDGEWLCGYHASKGYRDPP